MPRTRQTRGGDRAQRIESVPGQRYGEGVEQQAMQRQLPAPNRRDMPVVPDAVSAAAAQGAPPAGPTPGGPPPGPMAPDPAMIQQLLASAPRDLLHAPTDPGIPITAGLGQGPGPGAEALGQFQPSTQLSRFLRNLHQQTGDPLFARLAERAGL